MTAHRSAAPAFATGARRAALFLLAIEEEAAAEVLRHLDDTSLRRLAELTRDLDRVDPASLQPIFEEFERTARAPVPVYVDKGYVRRLTASAIGEDRARLLFDPPTPASPPMEAIRSARAGTLADLLGDEQPQVAAVILSQMSREQAAKVLAAMPTEKQAELLARIGALKEVPARAVQTASEALARAVAAAGGLSADADRREVDGMKCAAGLLNELAPDVSERLLGEMEKAQHEMVPKLREAMFTFEDLGRLDLKSLQVLLRDIQADQLLLALKTASEELREKFFGALSSRAAAALRDDLSMMPPRRLAEVEQAQREVVEAATRLAAEERLTLPGNRAEKVV